MKSAARTITIFLFFIFLSVFVVGVSWASQTAKRNILIQQTQGPSAGAITSGMTFSPKNPDIIYLDGYKSINGGKTWTEFDIPGLLPPNTLAVDPKNPDIVYLSTANILYKSIDSAKTWMKSGVLGDNESGITDIEVSPHDSDIIYAGTDAGNLFTSADGGQSWTDISNKINVEVPISRIAFNVKKPNEIFISTGSWYLSSLRQKKTGGNGLFKSSDSGNTFKHLKNEFDSYEVQDVDTMGDLVLVTTRHKLDHSDSISNLYKSTDSGKTWKKLLELFRLTHVAINPRDQNHVVVSGGDITPSFLLSYDGGKTWKEIQEKATEPLAYTHELEMVGDGRVYANDYYRPFMKSIDGGETWKWSSEGIRKSGIQVLEVNQKNRNDIFAGTIDGALHRSYDGGKTWKREYLREIENVSTIDFHPDNTEKFYLGVSSGYGGDGRHTGRATPSTGFYRTLDGGKTWKQSTDLITPESWGRQIEVYDIFVHPKNPNLILLGASRDGVWRSENGGKTWKESNNGIPEEGFYWHPLFDDPEEAAEELSCKEEAFKDPKHNQDCFYYAARTSMSIFLNPHDENEIWYTTLNGVFVSHDLGKTWKWLSDDLKNIHTHYMAFDPSDSNTIYVGTHQGAIDVDGKVITSSRGLLISRDGGKTWSQVDNKPNEHGTPTAPGEGHDIRAVAVDPKNPDFVAVGTTNAFFVSENKGETWREIKFTGQGSEVEDIRIDSSAKLIYLGTKYSGVWRGILDYDADQAAVVELTGVSFPSSSVANKPFSVIVSLDNLGGKAGSLLVSLKIGDYQSSKTISLSGADQSVVNFSPVLKKPGTYDVLINGTHYGKVVISKAARAKKKRD